MKINIAIAEDNDFLAKSLLEKLNMFSDKFNVVFRATNGGEIVEFAKTNNTFQVILMDIEMPKMDGIKATELISKFRPEIKTIILTVFDDDEKIFNAIKAGASGYLLKDESVEKIIDGINVVLEGGAPMSASIASKTLQLLRRTNKIKDVISDEDFNLSKREIEVLENLKLGLDYQQAAEKLFISPFTVRKHIENIYKKLQVNNKMQAVQKASAHKII
ncbi:MAG: response regulator transcription factor [Ignavibacteriales bacterium]|nr:response regulator transcription factor [Ignavibacteriales bacterium]